MNHGDTFTLKGLTFRMSVESDDGNIGAPWDEHDGHGPVREVRFSGYVPKTPGERVLYRDRNHAWLYDWAAACALAKRDGWGLAPEHLAALAKTLGREPKPGDIRAAAVQLDFDYCRRYASGDWNWAGVVVALLDVDGEPTPERESIGGIESDEGAYLDETARELAGEIAGRIGRRKFLQPVPAPRIRVRE